MFNLLYQELDKVKFRKKKRPNVNDDAYPYLIFHYTQEKFHPPGLSRINKKHPKVYQLLMDIMKEENKDYVFSSIIVNKNNVCKKHKDENNVGDSYIYAVGNYTGGRLFIEDEPYDIKNNIIRFDGSEKEHYSEEFQGTRYSIVYYNLGSIKKHLDNNNRDLLEHDGLKFNFRKFTTDYKVFEEVILKKTYNRYKVKFNENQVWLDLGGNIGTFTCLAAKHCKKVYSYEVEKENYKILKSNVKLNKLKNVEIFKLGVTEQGNEKKLYICNGDYNKYQHTLLNLKKKLKTVKIKSIRFKDTLSSDINCIKIDIEGAEMEILENNDFDNIDLLIFEYSFSFDNKTSRLISIIEKLKNNFEVYGNFNSIYKISNWDSYPRSRLVYCIKKKKKT